MSLCELCKSVSFDDLPPFPDEHCMRTLSGLPNFQHIILKKGQTLESLSRKHHPDLDSLRHAAASGCDICRLIEGQADAILADIAGIEDRRGPYQSHPRFDLWLTKRLIGGEGFTVLTNSTWEVGKHIIPVASFAFSAEYGSSPGASLPGWCITEVLDEPALGWAAEKVAACDHHERCNVGSRTLPARLLDVGTIDAGDKLEVIASPAQTSGRYIALSYCSGPDSSATSYEVGPLSLAALPQTFQDAVTVSRRLGVRSLWIDEICIPSQDKEAWNKDSPAYGDVFVNSYLTLAATSTTDKSGGLLVHRKPREYISLSNKTTDGNEERFFACTAPLDKEVISSYYVEMKSEPLSQNIWAFQDRVLSRRILHFSSDQLYFECLNGFFTEDGISIPRRYHHVYPEQEIDTEGGGALSYEETVRTHWHGTLRTYGYRKTDSSSVKLRAMANIARKYSELLHDEYIAGLWKGSLLEELCWQGLRIDGALPGNAPSWSWASVNGIAAAGFLTDAEPVATLVSHDVDLENSDEFHEVKAANIVLRAPLIPMVLSDEKGPTGHICLKPENGGDYSSYAGLDTIDRNYEVSAEILKSMKLFSLIVAATGGEAKKWGPAGAGFTLPKTYHCLIVTPVSEGSSSMKRLGFLFQTPEKLDAGQLQTETVVTLV